MKVDHYEGFADRYDLAGDKLDENEPIMIEFFRCLFARHDVHTILDCACGTGRHLLLFHQLGCKVWGSDVSRAMLNQAHKNLAQYKIQASLQQIDYRDLSRQFQRSFDAVACLAAIGYMPDENQFLRAFNSMHAVLRPGGVLILTAIPTDRQWQEKPRFMLNTNTSDFTRLFVMDYFERAVQYNILDIFHSQEASKLKVWQAELTALLRDEQEKLLKTTGFQQLDFYGAFDFSPYDKESNHLITVAQK